MDINADIHSDLTRQLSRSRKGVDVSLAKSFEMGEKVFETRPLIFRVIVLIPQKLWQVSLSLIDREKAVNLGETGYSDVGF